MIIERGGKFYRQETTEREISEIEALREKIKELEAKIDELQRRPWYISYVPVSDPMPWNTGTAQVR
jgi:hypothetical protein